ncbi:Rne/Rng family ribonuclease [Chamaesiphon minutus]|uniref:Ribonuclease, Rne/Rng family n=1 Tax=Chamaesiphon minutus (strain ATCC 27169 / PCC 6605) TaxID=1173020 RepID=K9UJF0_CHAP6|nr:Rne/Rng family ribonuclease [Chamaesiphon minutus]AFY94763.1 ribonuclease, Rne/Rng family [Chamaesiphon minutus PCC 6605]
MPKQIIIAEQHRIGAVFGEDQIQELVVATGQHQVSDIYLGIVENVLPGIDAAFINIGDPARNGFIHVTDLGPLRLRRSSGSITELLAPQQKVLVQIMKEPTGNKGPRLTGNVSLPGRYVVLIPFGKGVNLSRRIRSEGERNRLRALAVLAKPAGMGLLVRTEAEDTTEEAILEDLEQLQKQWEIVQQDANSTRAPALLNRDDDFIQRVLRDMYSQDVNRIVVDSEQGLKRVKQTLSGWTDGQLPQGVVVDRHRERQPILEYFRVNAAIRESLKPRVDLPSGGYIIIEPTEALTVVDVNSGSFTRSNTSRETVLWTNCEAATEIARQLRLRNIAGVIIIDFIDMDYRKDQLQVLEHFNKQLRVDKARPQIAQLSELGLVELTRKRQGQNIYELFGETCATCGGLGHLAHVPGETVYGADGEAVPISLVSTTPVREHRTRNNVDRDGVTGRGLTRGPRRNDRTLPDLRPSVVSVPEPWENFESEGTEGEDDFNLVNHPSYQQQNGVGKKRRRRVGRTEREEVVRNVVPRPTPNGDTLRTPIPNSNSPSRGVVTNNRGIPTSIENNNRATLISSDFAPPPLEAYVPDEPTGAEDSSELTDDAAKERDRPGKPQRVKPTRPTIEPPEVVSVEMSDLEKETYAWMGVSPLVKLGRELNNPKTAIVHVVPIGSLPPEPSVSAPSPTVEAIDTEDIATPEAPTSEIVEREFTIPVAPPEIALEQPEAEEEVAATPQFASSDAAIESAPMADPLESETLTAVAEVPEELPENRRRKRRSSAIVD